LLELDLSQNELDNLGFMENMLPEGIEKIDVSSNLIDELIHLRFISLYQQLTHMCVGLVERFPDLDVLAWVKYLCPTIEVFDEVDCGDVDPGDYDDDNMIDILVRASEQDLRARLSRKVKTNAIQWKDPEFIDFDNDSPNPWKEIQDRLANLERSVPQTPLIGEDDAVVSGIQREMSEIRKQIAKLAELLYVHDRALKITWERSEGGRK
jgi:hypothetical protein